MNVASPVLETFYRILVEEIARKRPEYLSGPFTVAEVYQDLVPYGVHRVRLGVEINGDYEDALIRLLAGEGGYLILESEHALRELRRELGSSNPNTGVYREYAAVDVRLDPALVPADVLTAASAPDGVKAGTAPEGRSAGGGGASAGFASSSAPQADPRAGVPSPEAGGAPVGVESGEGACRWCRAALPDREDLRFCPYCGTDVHTVPCPSCRQELEPDWRFCIACGTEVQR